MDWLADWLREIVIVILFAAFIDLLIPNNALQRYVKVALSLFILLTILSPLLRFLDGTFHAEGLLRASERLQQESGFRLVDDPNGGMPSLRSILGEGESLRQQNQSQAADVARSQLEQAVRTDMEQRTGRPVYSVTADLSVTEDGEVVLASIEVVVGRPEQAEETMEATPSEIRPVEDIRPVEIRITDDPVQEDVSEPVAAASDQLEAERARWEEELKREWGQQQTSVQVRFAEPDQAERG